MCSNSKLSYGFLIVSSCLFFSCTKAQYGWKDLENKERFIQSFSYGKDGGANQSVYYFLPTKLSKKKTPAIIFFHGGAWTGGGASTFFPHAAYYAQHGLASFTVNYRLLNNGARTISECIQDCETALQSICERADQLGIDTTRLILSGESAGGQLACAVYLNHSNRSNIRALLLLNPVLDFNTAVFLPYMDAGLLKKSAKKLPTDSLKILYGNQAISLSPLQYADQFQLPILLINGNADKTTPFETAQHFFDSHPFKKGASELVPLNETGHAFAIPHYKSSESVVVQTVERMDAFLRKLKLFKGKTNVKVQHYSDWLPAQPSK